MAENLNTNPTPATPSVPTTPSAAPGTPAAAPAQAGLKMSAAPAPSKTVTAAKLPAKTTSGGSKVQLIDQILAIAVALTAIACVVTSFMLQNLGNNPGY